MNVAPAILVIDDDRTVCSSLSLLLEKKGFQAKTIHQPSTALEFIEAFRPVIILLDMNFTIDTSGKQGLKLLKQIRAAHPEISVILMTGWATVQLAVQGMKLGAKDFVAKPWDNKELILSIKNILELHHTSSNPSEASISTESDRQIIGESPAIQQVMELVDRVAATNASVLISGESGTGKELIAEAIHQRSQRHEEAFVKVNLGGIPTELFESELFGHKKGAFTGATNDREGRFAKAHQGTIFLDEIGELNLTNQVKMLRVLQEKTFEPLGASTSIKTDVRIISATNRDLEVMTQNGQFREDLYYRINLLKIHLPPLRERRADIPLLVQHILKNIVQLYTTAMPTISLATQKWLSEQIYKGNIRQLKNIVERTFLLNMDKEKLGINDFLPAFNTTMALSSKEIGMNLEAMEIQTIKKALAQYSHSISGASKALGITRSSLYRRLEKYNIPYEPKS